MKMNFTSFSTALFCVTLLTACGDPKKEVSEQVQMIEDAEEAALRAAATGDNIQGRYAAHFTTLNPHVNGNIPGSAIVVREENKLRMFVRFSLGSPNAAHFQNIHMGKRCPQFPQDDTNGDGYIDIQEALAVVGPIIVPLDADISSQRSSNRFWPKAFADGSYTWNETTSFKHFWNDLKAKDWDEKDDIVKLAEDQGLAITGKVVLIQGINAEKGKELPDTVASHKRYPAYVTLPVTCGIFMPEAQPEGTQYVDEIPAEIGTAPVEPDQDRPAPEGAGTTQGNGTVYEGPTNSTGDNDANDTRVEDNGSNSGTTTGTNPTPTPPTSTERDRPDSSGGDTTNGRRPDDNNSGDTSTGNTTPTSGNDPERPTNTGSNDDEENGTERRSGGIRWPWE